jgi:hypothetical protein
MFGVWTEGDEGWADTEVLLDDCMEAPELDERVDIAERIPNPGKPWRIRSGGRERAMAVDRLAPLGGPPTWTRILSSR